jgi:hypothetical protein
MGQLDDAIREHLELKRRRGASDAELHQQEQEVFGPGRSLGTAPAQPAPEPDPAPEPAAEPVAEPFAEEHALPEPAAAPEPEPKPAPEPPPAPPEPVAAEPQSPPEPAAAPHDEPWLDEPDEVPFGESLDHRSSSVTNQPTREFTPAEEADAKEPPAEAEDVLEETPEFLQETPEHERLWFEQKPPRDFDF